MNNREKAEISAFLNGLPVAVIAGDVAPIGDGFAAVRRWATAIFEAQGGRAINPEVGEVILNEKSVRNSQAHYRRMPPAVANVFAAVKDVIEKGRIVLVEPTHNRQQTRSIYISAPVRIGDADDIVTVLVHQNPNTQRMYLHSAWTRESLLNVGLDKSTAGAERLVLSRPGDTGGIPSVFRDLVNFKKGGRHR
ncbi:MAG: hypothetical protein LBI59_08180 [Candidatus Accumulibacter sp.]|jgi:hypothetical protein|nr:hypothetical protein [Accumulibacter sp.]